MRDIMSLTVFLYSMNDRKKFKLQDLSDLKLDFILSLHEQELELYIDNLIQQYFSYARTDQELYDSLQESYKTSFHVEKLYRNNKSLQKGFAINYADSGLILNINNNLFNFQNNTYLN